MSPRHSARHSRKASVGQRLVVASAVVVLGGLGTVVAAAQFANPTRPRLSPTVSYPAMLAATDPSTPDDPHRGGSVSRSSARGASAGPASRTTTPGTGSARPSSSAPGPNSPHPTSESPTAASTTTGTAADYRQQVLELTNEQRAAANCPPLQMDPRLTQVAQGHSQDMADEDYFAHNDPDGTTPWDRARAAGYPDPSAENIAMGYPTPAAVMDAWMNSSGHRANILNCQSRDLGVGYVVDPNRGAIWTQLFGYG